MDVDACSYGECVFHAGRLSLLVVSALPFTQWLTLTANPHPVRLPHGQSHQSIQSRRHNELTTFLGDLHWVCVGNRDGFDFGSLGEFNWWDSWEMPCNIETSMTRRPLWSLILDPRSWSMIRAHHPGSFKEMFWRRSSLENWRMKR